MKRFLAILGAFALLGTLFVLATSASPAAANHVDDIKVNVENKSGSSTLDVTSNSPNCGDGQGASLAPGTSQNLYLNGDCNDWSVTAVDAAGKCTIEGVYGNWEAGREASQAGGKSLPYPPGNVLSGIKLGFGYWINFDTAKCIVEGTGLHVEKFVDFPFTAEAALTDFTVIVTPLNADFDAPQEEGGPCTAASTHTLTPDMGPRFEYVYDAAWIDPIVLQYITAGNGFGTCAYGVSELVPTGWSFYDYESNCDVGFDDSITPTVIVVPVGAFDGDCNVYLENVLDPIPLTVTKTFTGRDHYTTVDRADFHLYTPGLCGNLPFDPFGGLLGSVGLFRTINASQLPQVVMYLPHVPGALWGLGGDAGVCTYRVQENNAPEGCTAVAPDGSNADGPYWEQTWVPGATTEFTFNIVNDCADTPEPTPEPTVAPTSTPKKPGAKKPSGGGTAAPKFTG
jgi:hypothetical protein